MTMPKNFFQNLTHFIFIFFGMNNSRVPKIDMPQIDTFYNLCFISIFRRFFVDFYAKITMSKVDTFFEFCAQLKWVNLRQRTVFCWQFNFYFEILSIFYSFSDSENGRIRFYLPWKRFVSTELVFSTCWKAPWNHTFWSVGQRIFYMKQKHHSLHVMHCIMTM